MKAVILCAGTSTRTYPLTLTRPKPLLMLGEKTLLAHNLDQLQGIVTDVILIVGYLSSMIKKQFGKRYNNINIHYVEQKEQKGTGHALLQAQPYLREPFLVLMGDDLYFTEDLQKLSKQTGILVKDVKDPRRFGVITQYKGLLSGFEEKPDKPTSSLANTAAYCLSPAIFSLLEKLSPSPRGEIELPTAVLHLTKQHPVTIIEAKQWISIGYSWDLLQAAKILYPKGFIHPNAIIRGKVINSIIGDACIIDGNVNDSILFPSCIIAKGSIVNSSVLGEGVILEHSSIKSGEVTIQNNKLDQFGATIGDRTTLSKAQITAGSLIGPNKKLSGHISGVHYD